jgi:uncharacterized membrane protein YkoI
MKKRITLVAAVVAVAAAVAAGFAVAGSRDDHEQPITGTALVRASEAALAKTGGGRVTETEVGDEDAYYEVEVTLPDGREVDVHLDRSFAVVTSTADVGDSDGDESD